MPRRRHINPPLNIYRKIALSFIVITVVLIGVIFYFTLSNVKITITPKVQEISSDFNFIIVEDAQAVKPVEGIFSGQIINQEIEATKSFTATGSASLAGNTIGTVKIFNNLSRSQVLVATTRLLTSDNILFRIKNRVDVPAHGSIDVAVYPDDPAKPLAKAGDKFTIPGLSQSLQTSVYALASEDFKAAGATVKIVSKDDLDKALSSYTDELAQQTVKDIDSSKAKVLQTAVETKEFSNKAGDQVDNFSLKLKIKVSGAIFDQKEIVSYAQRIISQAAPPDKQIVADNSDKLLMELAKVDLVNHLAQLKSNVKANVVISESSQIFDRDQIKKMSVDQIKAYLGNFSDIEKVEVTFFPSWLKKMPFFKDRIIINVIK